MKTVGSFWRFMNNLPMLGGLEARYYFIMRGQIEPTFEYPANRNGTIWSVMCELDMMDIICTRLCIAIMGETLLPAHLAYNPNKDTTLINGISLCVKGKPANRNGGSNNRSVGKCCLIKIWLSRKIDITHHIIKACEDICKAKDLSIREIPMNPEYEYKKR
jgi:hypothetical protein